MSVAPDHAEIVRELTRYIVDFVEQPHPKLGNLPVCPFARKARLENRVQFRGSRVDTGGRSLTWCRCSKRSLSFTWSSGIHPEKDGISSEEVRRLVDALNETLPARN